MSQQLQTLYCFTKYSARGPSSRYRTYQYLDILKKHYTVKIHAGFGDWYFSKQLSAPLKALWLLKAFIHRCWKIIVLPSTCIVWIEYELFPYLPPFAEWYLRIRKIPYAVDYDDAIFHNYDQSKIWLVRKFFRKKIATVMRLAQIVVTGSPYLTKYALRHNPNVIEIPTSIDIEKYQNSKTKLQNKPVETFVAGWLGSTTTSNNVLLLKTALEKLATQIKIELWIMGFDKRLAAELEGLPVKLFTWEQATELTFLNSIDLGLMPLYDTPFNRGKCGFKLIQYMAVAKPTLSTPLEANKKINRTGKNGHADNDTEWCNQILYFANHEAERKAIGGENQEIVKEFYSIQANADKLIQVINQLK